jgi:ABC-type lipoprotein release transport system permease subunit
MNLIRLSLKNATAKWWRSFTLGFFILAASLVIMISDSMILAIQHKVSNVIQNGLTGRIQIRAAASREADMVEQYNKSWDALKPLGSETIQNILKIVARELPQTTHTVLMRQSAYVNGNGKREETMLIGIETDWRTYREAFLLKSGRYLNATDENGILLTEEQAGNFQVKVGDSLRITTKNRYGLNAEAEVQVVGIGNFIMLSLFSYKANYIPATCVRKLAGFDPGESTDLLLFTGNPEPEPQIIRQLSLALSRQGIGNIISAAERLTSADLKVSDLKFDADEHERQKVKISSHLEMGQIFKSVGDSLLVTLNILTLFMMVIVSILIFNLVYLMGIERYREIGTLRAIGFSRTRVIQIFMGEILSITFLGGLAGILISSGLILFFRRTGIPSPVAAMDFIMGKTLYPELDGVQVATTMAILTGFALLASFYPAYKAAAVDPAQTIRSV